MNIRVAVMNNLLPSNIKYHEKYDLKGSTYKRKASPHELTKTCPTFKDLDYRERHDVCIWVGFMVWLCGVVMSDGYMVWLCGVVKWYG